MTILENLRFNLNLERSFLHNFTSFCDTLKMGLFANSLKSASRKRQALVKEEATVSNILAQTFPLHIKHQARRGMGFGHQSDSFFNPLYNELPYNIHLEMLNTKYVLGH